MKIKSLTFAVTVTLLAACGGGGDSDSRSTSQSKTTASLAGLYLGDFTENPSGENYDLAAIVAPSGSSYLLSFDAFRIYVGDLKGAGSDFSGNVLAYDVVAANSFFLIAEASAERVIAKGSFTARSHATGAFSSNQGQVGTFFLGYLAESLSGASYEKIAGRWAGSDPDTGDSVFVDVASDGSFSGSDSFGCALSGQVSIPDPSLNVYKTTYSESCAEGNYNATGLLEIEQDGEEHYLIGALSGGGLASVFILTKVP